MQQEKNRYAGKKPKISNYQLRLQRRGQTPEPHAYVREHNDVPPSPRSMPQNAHPVPVKWQPPVTHTMHNGNGHNGNSKLQALLDYKHFLTPAFQNAQKISFLKLVADFSPLPFRGSAECAVAADEVNGAWKITRFFRAAANEPWQSQEVDADKGAPVSRIVKSLATWSYVAGRNSSPQIVQELSPRAALVDQDTRSLLHEMF